MTQADSYGDDPLLHRIRSEFGEMPGLCLTTAQAARLWNLPPADAGRVLQSLVEGQVLTRTQDGRYVAGGG